jgi:hypothetical protein
MSTTFPYQIDSRGNFTPSSEQILNRGTKVTFSLDTGATWTLVYVYSGRVPAHDSTLFGATSVLISAGATIATSAVVNNVYTLSVSSTAPAAIDDTTTGSSGSIKVGGG